MDDSESNKKLMAGNSCGWWREKKRIDDGEEG